MAKEHTACFRFYEELNDFLIPEQRKRTLRYRFNGHPGIQDAIEAFGVPPAEVDLIIVNAESVGFAYRLQPDDRVAVYPTFESFDITPLVKLRERPLRRTRFVVAANLGELARQLGMSRPLLYLHLRKLELAGLIAGQLELSADGRAMKFYGVVPFDVRLVPAVFVKAANTLSAGIDADTDGAREGK